MNCYRLALDLMISFPRNLVKISPCIHALRPVLPLSAQCSNKLGANGLTHYQTTNFKLKESADDNFKFDGNSSKVLQKDRKHCGKRRNCSLRAISPFPTVFSKGLFPILFLGRVESIVRKGENAGYQHFLLLLQCFPKPSPLGRQKSGFCGEELLCTLTLNKYYLS